jgi:MFS family permease
MVDLLKLLTIILGGILSIPYVKSLLLSLTAMGLLFGSNFVVIIAVADQGGRASDGGLWVGLYPLGSAISGLIYGFIHWKISSTVRYTVSLAVMTVCTSGILFFQDLDTIAFWIIVSGIAIGPALISANAFLKELVPLSLGPKPGSLKIVYTAMHGVGTQTLAQVFEKAGFAPLILVKEQSEPDPDFPTVAFPNPEEPGAIDLAIFNCSVPQCRFSNRQ